jgi:hypothetical protein
MPFWKVNSLFQHHNVGKCMGNFYVNFILYFYYVLYHAIMDFMAVMRVVRFTTED